MRLARWRRDRPGETERLLILLYLVSAPIQAVFFTRVRFRAPLDPLLIVIAAAMVARWLVQRGTAERRRHLIVARWPPTTEPLLEPAG